MTTDQLISTIAIVLTAAAGIALLVQMERTHRRSQDRNPGRSAARAGERLDGDADHRRLVEDLRVRAAQDPTAPATTADAADLPARARRAPHPAGVTSLSRPAARTAR